MKPMVCQEDRQRYNIWNILSSRDGNFRDHLFQPLVHENPSVLKISNRSRLSIPLYYAAQLPLSIRPFKTISQTGVRYYPNKDGISLLFKMVNTDKTPFQIACERFGRDEVMDAVEGTLLTFQHQQLPLLDDDGNNNNNNTSACGPPYNLAEALITASVNENIHLDCVFFLIRRHPNVQKELLVVAPAMEGNDDSSSIIITWEVEETMVVLMVLMVQMRMKMKMMVVTVLNARKSRMKKTIFCLHGSS